MDSAETAPGAESQDSEHSGSPSSLFRAGDADGDQSQDDRREEKEWAETKQPAAQHSLRCGSTCICGAACCMAYGLNVCCPGWPRGIPPIDGDGCPGMDEYVFCGDACVGGVRRACQPTSAPCTLVFLLSCAARAHGPCAQGGGGGLQAGVDAAGGGGCLGLSRRTRSILVARPPCSALGMLMGTRVRTTGGRRRSGRKQNSRQRSILCAAGAPRCPRRSASRGGSPAAQRPLSSGVRKTTFFAFRKPAALFVASHEERCRL